MKTKANSKKTHFDHLMEREQWHANDLGLSLSPESCDYWFSFAKTKPSWLKVGAKRFIYQQSSTKTFATCSSYLKALNSFGLFITNLDPNIKPNEINRELIINYIHELCAIRKLKPSTVQSRLHGIKYFFEINAREQWFALPQEPLVFYDDFPRRKKSIPKFIPDIVIEQLLRHIPSLSEAYQNLVILFLETGRRKGEIFSLAYYCLHQDDEGDYYLKVEDRKMQTDRLIPISGRCVEHIKKQQAIADKLTSSREYLFVKVFKGNIQPMKSRYVHTVLNNLAKDKNIVDSNGLLWHFHFHQFRHTVATKMINHGVPQHIVQRYLGHESSEMTARYASIHDHTLKKEFIKFKNRIATPNEEPDPTSLADYQQQLETIKKCIEMAELKGWKEALTESTKIQRQIENMIATIK